MNRSPSAGQIEALRRVRGALVLFYEFDDPSARDTLAGLAREHGGAMRWAAAQEQVLIGRITPLPHAAQMHFPSAVAAEAFVASAGHAAALASGTSLRVTVFGEQPWPVKVASMLMSWVLPLWPFDDTVDAGEEPGVGVSTVMPGREQMVALRAHPDQASPVVMVNWLKFRRREAYYRYGRIALTTANSLGAKLLFAARYRLTLIGNDGDPGPGLWDEFALMQYPGRGAFQKMASLRRYRRGLADREAGLAEHGQGLVVSRPALEFVRGARRR